MMMMMRGVIEQDGRGGFRVRPADGRAHKLMVVSRSTRIGRDIPPDPDGHDVVVVAVEKDTRPESPRAGVLFVRVVHADDCTICLVRRQQAAHEREIAQRRAALGPGDWSRAVWSLPPWAPDAVRRVLEWAQGGSLRPSDDDIQAARAWMAHPEPPAPPQAAVPLVERARQARAAAAAATARLTDARRALDQLRARAPQAPRPVALPEPPCWYYDAPHYDAGRREIGGWLATRMVPDVVDGDDIGYFGGAFGGGRGADVAQVAAWTSLEDSSAIQALRERDDVRRIIAAADAAYAEYQAAAAAHERELEAAQAALAQAEAAERAAWREAEAAKRAAIAAGAQEYHL